MRVRDIAEDLKVAITAQDHVAYAAAARIGWPDALFDLQEAKHECDMLSTFLLRRTREAAMADQIVIAMDRYFAQSATSSPELARLMREYKELRGLGGGEK